MSISGRRESFQQGRLDNVDLKFNNTRWELKEGASGKETARLMSDLLDADGNEHPWNWVALGGVEGDRKSRLSVADGRLVAINEDGDEVRDGAGLSDMCGAAKLFDSLQEHGISPKKLDKVGDDPSVLDDTIWHFENVKSGRKGDDGKEFSDLLVTGAVDEEDFGSGGGSRKSSKSSSSSSKSKRRDEDEEDEEEDEKPRGKSGKGTSGKARAADRDEESEEESEDEDESVANEEGEDEDQDESESGDEVTDTAIEAMKKILSDPSEYVKNFNAKKNDGGLTLKEVYIAGVTAIKGKNKGEACNLLRDAKFHKANAKAGLYAFDPENGIVRAKKKGGR